jgi:methylmalonyl-CoA/ethylmalonyl-CoA epimerase
VTPEPLGMKLDHIGFVVADIDLALNGFAASFGAQWDGRIFDDPLQKVRVAFLSVSPEQPRIELVQPAQGQSPVLHFLKTRGPGLHHVCYETASLEEQCAAMRARRALIVSRPKPAVAFEGRRIAWMLTAEGLLVELLEAARARVGIAGG